MRDQHPINLLLLLLVEGSNINPLNIETNRFEECYLVSQGFEDFL